MVYAWQEGASGETNSATMTHLGRELSPELALVSLELAESLRAALPERPWEQFVPRTPLRPPRAIKIAPRRSEPFQPTARRAVNGSRVAAVLALAGIVAVGALADNRELPRPTTHVGRALPTKQAGVRIRNLTKKAAPAVSPSHPASRSPTHPKPIRATRPIGPAVRAHSARTARRIPPGIYAFGPDGRLVVAPGGATMRFQATTRCFGPLVIVNIRVSPRGTFLVRRSFGGRRGTVTLSGRYVGPRVIDVALNGSHGGCTTGRVSFAAHVS